jgi:ribonuclease P protein component
MKRQNRILKHQEFDEIIRTSPYLKSSHFVIHYRPNKAEKARIGISVSKRNGNAVTRNLIKRQIRAMIGQDYDLSNPFDVIIIVRTTYDPTQFHSLEEELASSLAKIGEKH